MAVRVSKSAERLVSLRRAPFHFETTVSCPAVASTEERTRKKLLRGRCFRWNRLNILLILRVGNVYAPASASGHGLGDV